MKKSCRYCGKIHDTKYVCGKKPKPVHIGFSQKDTFRSSRAWQLKREEIKERDNYLCQICLRKLYDTQKILNSENLSVHHVEKLEENYEKRLENDNLITVCEKHHKMCDNLVIPKSVLRQIISEQTPPEGSDCF